MSVTITHTTPADSSFSTQGATAWNATHSVSGLGTMATQDANNVAITGGAIDGTTVGATSASSGKFTTLSASSTVSGTGFSTYLASPPAIGGTTAAAATFTTLTATGQTSLGGAAGSEGLRVLNTASAVNWLQATGSITTKALQFTAQGSDTNIAAVFQSKGTGAIDLAAGSSGVNISNGGTVTAITRTSNSGTYTSIPSVAISAPTTAGGVQATASVATMIQSGSSPTINGGGTGYTVGDVLTVVGGTPSSVAATMTVTTVSAGVITGVNYTNFASYTALPSNPFSVTGGTGSGATFNSTWYPNNFTITNAGSGYVEQPTVTFSGGGGSGAAAYASVGSNPTVKGLAGTLNFATSGGINFAVLDSGQNPPAAYPYATGGSSSAGYGVAGSATNAGFTFTSKGTSAVDFYTNGYGSLALKASHTASAVNYVQVTGAATSLQPVISAQGSDTNVGLILTSKGTSSFQVRTNNNNNVQMFVTHTASSVNWVQMTGAAAGAAPSYAVAGSDANIDLALTPKGTGNVRFGTYTANMALTVQGYIEIKDAGGTVRKLAVIA